MTTRKKVSRKKPSKKKAAKKAPARKPASKKKAAKKAPARKPAPAADQVEPVELTRKAEWSISQFWLNTGFARETVRKRFAEAGLKPSRTVKGYPVYLASDALPVLFYMQDGEVDPDKLKPFERRAFYQGELDKLKLQVERGELVPSFEVEAQMARLFKLVTRALDTLPDILERDVGMTNRQLERIELLLDELRTALYGEIAGDPDAAGTVQAGA